MDDAQDAVQAKASEVADTTSDAVDNFKQGVLQTAIVSLTKCR